MTLKISISGIRGIAGSSLTPDVALNFGLAFGDYCRGGKIILGSDTRTTGPMLKHAIICGLMAAGCEIVDIGVVPTPTVQVMVREYKATGGVIITASHNPIEWNGLKFVRNDGIFLNQDQAQQLIDLYEEIKKGKNVCKDYRNPGKFISDRTAADKHINKVLSNIDVSLISSKKIKIAFDPCNGAGSVILPEFFRRLGCEVTVINGDPTGVFAHTPEPVPQNLVALQRVMQEGKYDVGFAVDPDADRLAILDETGRPIGEDYTLTLAVDYILSRREKGGLVVTNLSTSQCIDRIAARYGATVVRTKIGEVNVSETMLSRNATIGGEGNGGVINPVIGYGRDSLAGTGCILEMLARSGKTVSAIVNDMPKYIMVKDKIGFPSARALTQVILAIKNKYKQHMIDEQDGIKIIFRDSWVHLRASNTEPIIRIIAEDASQTAAEELVKDVKEFFKSNQVD